MSDLLGIAGTLSNPSNTRAAVEVTLRAAEEEFAVETEILHLAEYDIAEADGRKLDEYTGDTADALELIIDSRAFIIGTPVYRGSYSGILKNLLDLIPRGLWQSNEAPLEDRPVGLVATGATAHHYLSVAQELGPLLSFFGSYPVGGGVYAESSHFDNHKLVDDEVRTRLATLGKATVELSRAVDQSRFLSSLGPQF
ncbi:MAG: NAD(P)H-dependent oxidoreductase [Balneolaceae bacterium]|nr:NAD(P)H-dependent oxidoreductase [Balneolaceae bacterium]